MLPASTTNFPNRFRERRPRCEPILLLKAYFIVIGTILSLSAGTAHAAQRVALVIGNGGYTSVPKLRNPPNDAGDIAASFERLGFSVEKVIDAKAEDMRQALKRFGGLAQDAEIAVIFFAGHGMEIRGDNWLIPIDAELHADIDAEAEAINLNSLTLQVGRASRLGLVILDSCRNNPFVNMRRTDASRAANNRGLVRVEPPNNILVAFAARDGTTASDGDARNSPFTSALLASIEKPGIEVSLLFRKVRDEVMTKTNREQQPFVYGSLSRDMIYLKPPLEEARPKSPSSNASTGAPVSEPVSDCDRLAAHPKDSRRPDGVVGVGIKQIDVVSAKAACDAAMLQHPAVARFVYQAGRIAYAQKNYALALGYFNKAVSSGYAAAAINLGALFETGEAVATDYSKARHWYEKAAAAGDAAGINALGALYQKGLGVAQSYDQALKWYMRAAAAGDPDACNNIGVIYASGKGVPQDYVEARKWYEKAAAAGHASAMNSIGVLFQTGSGVDQNYATAREWFDKAAILGDKDAMKNLGGLYFNGYGVGQDYVEARRWYEKAADKGSSEAMNDLGLLYANGYGVEKDATAARQWHEKAAAAGNGDAKVVAKTSSASSKHGRR